jgi:hypothetical protein
MSTHGLFDVGPMEGEVIAFLSAGPCRRRDFVGMRNVAVTLHRLKEKGFVERGGVRLWHLTPKGYAVAAANCVYETLTTTEEPKT